MQTQRKHAIRQHVSRYTPEFKVENISFSLTSNRAWFEMVRETDWFGKPAVDRHCMMADFGEDGSASIKMLKCQEHQITVDGKTASFEFAM